MSATPKPPAPQAVSALLARAGFTRSASNRTAGFHVTARTDWVRVVHDSGLALPSAADRAHCHRMEDRYAAVLRAAGWMVGRDEWDALTVTAAVPETVKETAS